MDAALFSALYLTMNQGVAYYRNKKEKREEEGRKRKGWKRKREKKNNGIDESGSMKIGASNTSQDQRNISHKKLY